MCIISCVSLSEYALLNIGTPGNQRPHKSRQGSNGLKLKSKAVASFQMWVLGTELGTPLIGKLSLESLVDMNNSFVV